MPAKGKHRRPKANPISRGFIAAGTGGAAIALPLIGATGAHAAEKAAPAAAPQAAESTAEHAARNVSAAQAQGGVKQAATQTAKTYAVVSGDYLSRIADEQKVRGGWQKLYDDNRSVVGDDPSMIHPGLKLTIGTKSAGGGSEAPASEAPAKAEAPVKSSSGSTGESSGSGATERKAPAANTGSQSSGSDFAKPVDAPVTTQYRASGGSWSSGYHTGVDFSASSGSTVKAVGAGTVVSAGWGGSYGNEVVIRHDDGKYSQYGHMSSLAVSTGQSVGEGQQIGLSGATGNVTGPHLHFEIRTGPDYGSDIDPLAFLRQQGVNV
ncbi:peptidoglycan DD-metalloendopeptidase family protein [Streptomyces sp. NPDC088400]|uniref:M23 family metallopeptidase n=1 Tax=Streptomyces sp. NPDC088400 TaxID=3365861 RepID=UPI0037FC8FFD